jgi:DNA-directed RNA polymerase specialized sigma subunit
VIIAKTNLAELDAEAARNRLLIAHEGAIRSVAAMLSKSLRHGGLINELVQEGRIALNWAIDHFEPYSNPASDNEQKKNERLRTYSGRITLNWASDHFKPYSNPAPDEERRKPARLWTYSRRRVIGAMLDFVGRMRHGGITGLGRQLDVIKKVHQAHDEIMSKSGKKPSVAEIATRLKLTEKAVENALNVIGIAGDRIVSLTPSAPDVIQLLGTEPPIDKQLESKEQFQALIRALKHLRSPRYDGHYDQACDYFELRYFKELGVDEIADLKGVNRTTVWRGLEEKIKPALDRLRTHLPDDVLALYHIREVKAEDREHVEMHLVETSPGDHYCRYCYRRFDTLKSVVPLYLQGLESEQVVMRIQEDSNAIRKMFSKLCKILPHFSDDELKRDDMGAVDKEGKAYAEMHLRHCSSCSGRRRSFGLLTPLILSFFLLWQLWLNASNQSERPDYVSSEAAAAPVVVAGRSLPFPRRWEGGNDASIK